LELRVGSDKKVEKNAGLYNLISSPITAMKLWLLNLSGYILQVEKIRNKNRILANKYFGKRHWKF
jgi:hypothetical protein